MKHPRSAEEFPTPADLGEPGPGAELVDHLGAVLERLTADPGSCRPSVLPPAPNPGADDVVVPVDGTDDEAPLEALRVDLMDLFEAQATSRWLDVAARRMAAAGLGAHTVASAGHEGNAAVAMALRSNDPALPHHRSTAFYLARMSAAGLDDGIADVVTALAGTGGSPTGRGMSAVPSHPGIAVLPAPCVTGGHLPRAVGMAWALGRRPAGRSKGGATGTRLNWPSDAVTVAGFGDGTAGHATAIGAVNAACWASRQGVPMPLLLVCEDNGLSFSLPGAPGAIAEAFGSRAGLRYFHADTAGDPAALFATVRRAVETVRAHRRPVFLHLSCVRIGGGSGADDESRYRRADRIAADLTRDPLVATMTALVGNDVLTGAEVADRLLHLRDRVASALEEAIRRPRPATDVEVVASPSPRRPAVVAMAASREPDTDRRAALFPDGPPEGEGHLTLAASINRSLLDAAITHPGVVLVGRDVGRAGGLYGVTRGLQKKLGPARVVDVVPDGRSILGLAMGAGVSGLLPIAELSGPGDLHAVQELLRAEVATLAFASAGAFRNPMVLRVSGLGYHDGAGGSVWVDNALGVLRDIPGLVVAALAQPSQAPAVLRSCLAAAETDGTVSVIIEPVALYDQRDLLLEGDDGWAAPYAPPPQWSARHAPIGRAAVWGEGEDLTIASYGNGLWMSMRAAAQLEREGIGCRVVDLRWLAPLPIGDVVEAARATGRLLVVDETRRTGGVSEGLVTGVLEAGFDGRLARVTSKDSPVPTGPAAELVMLSENSIVVTARALCEP